MILITFLFVGIEILSIIVSAKVFHPKTSDDIQKSIDQANPGDTIQLDGSTYKGDFVIQHSGNNNRVISILGVQNDDGAALTQIQGNLSAFYIQGNYWSLKDLNVSALDEGIVIEGDNNRIESVSINGALGAVAIIGNQNHFGSVSISDVKDGILLKGSDNVFRDVVWSNATTGILIESGDRNVLHNLAIHNNVKEGIGLLLETGTCCGRLTNVIIDGIAEIKGNNYYFRQTIANEAINILGCDNTFGRSVFSRTYFTTECSQLFRSSNIFHYPQTKKVTIKDI